jgi:hypothetical protein
LTGLKVVALTTARHGSAADVTMATGRYPDSRAGVGSARLVVLTAVVSAGVAVRCWAMRYQARPVR